MSTEDEYALLAENFSRSGYLIERRLIGGVDSIVVVGKPDRVNGITLYKRSIQLHQDAECQWHTSLGTITLPWRQSSEALGDFVLEWKARMPSTRKNSNVGFGALTSMHNKPLVPTRKSEALLLAAQRRR